MEAVLIVSLVTRLAIRALAQEVTNVLLVWRLEIGTKMNLIIVCVKMGFSKRVITSVYPATAPVRLAPDQILMIV